MLSLKLKGPGLNDWFAEQLVKDHGPEGARAKCCGPGATEDTMNHDTSYMNTNYARDKSLESYQIEEKEKITAKEEMGATARAGVMLPCPAPEKEDDETSN